MDLSNVGVLVMAGNRRGWLFCREFKMGQMHSWPRTWKKTSGHQSVESPNAVVYRTIEGKI